MTEWLFPLATMSVTKQKPADWMYAYMQKRREIGLDWIAECVVLQRTQQGAKELSGTQQHIENCELAIPDGPESLEKSCGKTEKLLISEI